MQSLRAVAADFAAREADLSREMGSRRVAETRRHQAESQKLETWLAAENARLQADFTDTEARLRKRAADRLARIDFIYRKEKANLQEKARLAKERWLGGLQMKHFRATRSLPLDLQAEDDAHAAFSARLSEWENAAHRLDHSVRRALGGYPAFIRLWNRQVSASVDSHADREVLLADLQAAFQATEARLEEFRRFLIPRLFSLFPLWAWILLLCGAAGAQAVIPTLGVGMKVVAVAVAVIGSAGLAFLHWRGGLQSRAAAAALAESLAPLRALAQVCPSSAQRQYEQQRRALQEDYDRLCAEINLAWAEGPGIEKKFAVEILAKLDAQAPRLRERNQLWLDRQLESVQGGAATLRTGIDTRLGPWRERIAGEHETAMASLAREDESRWADLASAWKQAIEPLYAAVDEMNASLAPGSSPWEAGYVAQWTPARETPPAVRMGHFIVDLLAGAHPADARLPLPGPAQLEIPLALAFPEQGTLLFETKDSGADSVIGSLNNIILRLLANTPPGRISFTIIDPVGLGQNFAGLMHLADFEETLINRRIWTQRDHIEERLAELNEHIEKVIQMYLRNEYETIADYNEQAGSVAEKYHFLIIADFPANFSETAARRLQSIIQSGPRCGVYTLLHWDLRQPLPEGLVPGELRKNGVYLKKERAEWFFPRENVHPGSALVLDAPPEPPLAIDLVHRIGQASIDSNRVEVPFSQVAPPGGQLWTGDTTGELRVAIGRTGATKLQYLSIGKGTRQHALFAGKTGSGKSTLFHVIITNLALSCSPDEVEFYLIDFKKGVEFKCYATHRLPHARVVAIESDREFGLSVLHRVDQELKRRGDMFRKLGVQDIAGYKRAGGREPVPRSLLIIDEFQEFFVQDDEISQTASLLFDRIVRQGRAFGIHVLLGSQTLGGAYTLARATLGQMVIRVALQCSEADAYLIMDDNNPAPRLLSRPGEGIYNDAAGALEGNSPFQVVWLSDSERDARLEEVRELAVEKLGPHYPAPIVFEGNAPAAIAENPLLRAALDTPPAEAPAHGRAWFGAPNSIKGPTEALFQRQSGSHLLIVGQNDEAIVTSLGLSITALAAQYPSGFARFVFLSPDGRAASPLIDRLASILGSAISVAQPHEAADAVKSLAAELQSRINGESAPDVGPIYLLIHNLHRFKKLRNEDDFNFSGSSEPSAADQLNTLLTEGGTYGIHVIATVDTYNNVTRFLSRKAQSEFEMRIVYQMSANDSASLIDAPAASDLGLHRALFYNESKGTLETFRPYAAPDPDWIDSIVSSLASRQPGSAPVS